MFDFFSRPSSPSSVSTAQFSGRSVKFRFFSVIDCPLLYCRFYCILFGNLGTLKREKKKRPHGTRGSSKKTSLILQVSGARLLASRPENSSDNQPSASVDSNPLVITDYPRFPASRASDHEHNRKSGERRFLREAGAEAASAAKAATSKCFGSPEDAWKLGLVSSSALCICGHDRCDELVFLSL